MNKRAFLIFLRIGEIDALGRSPRVSQPLRHNKGMGVREKISVEQRCKHQLLTDSLS